MNEELWCIIPAAGHGTRACSREPKQFVTISGKTILEWTASKVLALPEVDGVVLAPVSYTHLDVYKRQTNFRRDFLLSSVYLNATARSNRFCHRSVNTTAGFAYFAEHVYNASVPD